MSPDILEIEFSIETRGGGNVRSGKIFIPYGKGCRRNKVSSNKVIQGFNAPSILKIFRLVIIHSSTLNETYPRGCCSSPSPIPQNSVAPRPCILLQSFLAGQQNFSYAVSPSPNTANDKSSNKSFGRSERMSLFHSKVIERGSIPEPVVDTTNITRLCEIRSC
jgi:hypothetical protein